jgi:acyl-CoA synthetase (AMP-forming)/AMP-acid ligase II
MTIIDLLERNAKNAGGEVALVEFNPNIRSRKEDWKEFGLNVGGTDAKLRKELTWGEFDVKANRVANYLLSQGVKKGDKVAILLMNCLEWLPIYFGVLKTGALAVPMNYRYTSDEINYCLDLSDSTYLIFGQEFITRIEEILPSISGVRLLYCASGLHDTIPEFATDLL